MGAFLIPWLVLAEDELDDLATSKWQLLPFMQHTTEWTLKQSLHAGYAGLIFGLLDNRDINRLNIIVLWNLKTIWLIMIHDVSALFRTILPRDLRALVGDKVSSAFSFSEPAMQSET